MGKVEKIMFGNESSSIRRQIHELCKHPKQRLMHLKEIPRPKYVTQTNGVRVKYEGP
jgi:hypothetical protein